jgi:hypothetical protein
MRVVFCVKDIKSNYRVTAYGDLAGLADDEDIGPFVGKELSFTIEQEFGDVRPFAERLPTGIVSATEKGKFYEFEIVSGSGDAGRLKILALAKEQGCLPVDAP